ncbi:hypothetical protein HDU93_004864 [Gonapodya sp. JEL0774]|nr:hypothetical protein HDU93_004864 [Gonapodya sp. JEL0774]
MSPTAATPTPTPAEVSSPPVVVRMGGVPEHFMVPLEAAVRDGRFLAAGFEVEWKQCHGGTAEMLSGLSSGSLDIAFPLTESAIAGIESSAHPSIRLIGSYVSSPLNWAISVHPDSTFQTQRDLQGTTCAISRYGSGSHVMAAVFEDELRRTAEREGVPFQPFEYVVCGTGEGMMKAVREEKAQFFMWEYFTSKPWYDQLLLRHLSTRPTPWPAFAIASTLPSLTRLGPSHVSSLLALVTDLVTQFTSMHVDDAVTVVRGVHPRYHDAGDLKTWFGQVRYEKRCEVVSEKVVKAAVEGLRAAGVLKDVQGMDGVKGVVAGGVDVVE